MVRAVREHLAAIAVGPTTNVPDAESDTWLDWPDPHPGAPIPALLRLRAAFGLTGFEVAVLALCVAHELDAAIGPLCAGAAGDPERAWPSFALALRAFPGADWEAVAATGRLRAWQLVAAERRFGEPLLLAALRCDERVLDFVKGLNRLDARLAPMVDAIAAPDGELPDPAAAAALLRLWEDGRHAGLVSGGEPALRLDIVAAVARTTGRAAFRIDAEVLPTSPDACEALARLWTREAVLLPLVLVVTAGGEEAATVRRFVDRLALPCAVCTDSPAPRELATLPTILVTPPDGAAQEHAWRVALGPGREALVARVAGTFDLPQAEIFRIAATAPPGEEAAWRHCVTAMRPGLDALAQRIEPRLGWDDLVLPPEQRGVLRQIADQVRQRRRVHDDWGYAARLSRGLGVTALFAGDSGTGKTMAAEVLAAELGLNLYRIDLSAVVSKYIGETEKNLRRLFDAAERGGAVLLFDEADALFGKRTEVKDSHDRYANIEVNYLLQRIESFAGLAILATNFKAALDSGFLRRLRFVVRFPYPGPAERAALWRGAFPTAVPCEPLDFARLAGFNLTGGHIVTAALNAAFLAAAEDAPVAMRHVLQAARAELVKLNRPILAADFALPTDLPARAAE
ncbi:ATP-binding protein [Dankookia rubra]|uniref:ATP-binding protein n=2 Tax=Dankookia rubra TaxID=1442381 RepID=A0A4R5QHF5_9PROT|nr:ATP-binding protein [Dankookia rubra]